MKKIIFAFLISFSTLFAVGLNVGSTVCFNGSCYQVSGLYANHSFSSDCSSVKTQHFPQYANHGSFFEYENCINPIFYDYYYTFTPVPSCPSGTILDANTSTCIAHCTPQSSYPVSGLSPSECTGGGNIIIDNGFNISSVTNVTYQQCDKTCYALEPYPKDCAFIYSYKKPYQTCDINKNDFHYSCSDSVVNGKTVGTYDMSCEPKTDPCIEITRVFDNNCEPPKIISGSCVSNLSNYTVKSNTLQCTTPAPTTHPCEAYHAQIVASCQSPSYVVGTCADDGTNITTPISDLYRCYTPLDGNNSGGSSGGTADSTGTSGVTSALDNMNKSLSDAAKATNDATNNINDSLSSTNSKLDSLGSGLNSLNSNIGTGNGLLQRMLSDLDNIVNNAGSGTDPFNHDLTDGSENFGTYQTTITNQLGVTQQSNILGLSNQSYQLQTYSFSLLGHTFIIFEPSMLNSIPIGDIRNIFLMIAAIGGFITVFRTV